jgi:hypothetical protein
MRTTSFIPPLVGGTQSPAKDNGTAGLAGGE